MYHRRPQHEIVGSVNGDLAQNVAQKAIAGILPSLPEIVAVVVGVSPLMFDTLVKDGRMPSAKTIESPRVWGRGALNICFDALPSLAAEENAAGGDANPWD